MSRELTREEKRKIRVLVTKWCANYDKEYGCLPLDCECYMLGKCWTGALCRYFREAVLPLDPALEAALLTLSLIHISLPVADLAAPNSALFLWATFPQLPEALRLIQAWGFTYKSVAFVWLKKNRKADSWFYGLGFWTRGNAEICLLATRGHPKRQAANIHQFIISPIEAHSKKPDEARDKIVALMGDVPRVELFARQSPPGWDVWGNEVESTVPDFWTKCPEVGL